MKSKLGRRLSAVALVVILCLFSSGVVLALAGNDPQLLWASLAEEDYQRALELAIAQGRKNPLYSLLAYYLSFLSFNSSAEIRMINFEYIDRPIREEDVQAFTADLAKYGAQDPVVYKLVKAIYEFNENRNEAEGIRLVREALAERETCLGHYLHYCFTGDVESCQRAAALAERPGYLNQLLLILDYNANWERGQEPDKEKYVAALEKILADDDYYFDTRSYLNFIQMGLGERWVSAIGPGGPNGEPFFGALCAFTAWDAFPRFAPRHQILLTLAVAGPGGQNTWDGEELLGYIAEETRKSYAPLVTMIKIYENFHEYQYAEVYRLADELLAMEITDPFYFFYFYDLAYEYEMFFFRGYYPEQTMIEKAVRLYEKAYQLAPPDSAYWQGVALRGKGRSEYYAKAYQASLTTLTETLTLLDEPTCSIFICLDYYALGDWEKGAAWEQKVRATFADNAHVLAEFEEMLSAVKAGR